MENGPRLLTSAGILFWVGLLAAAIGVAESDRSRLIVDHRCETDVGWKRLSLFANGTVRLKERTPGQEETMLLGELSPGDLRAYQARLEGVDLSEADSLMAGPSTDGEWVESCETDLDLYGPPVLHFEFGRYDSLPLSLSRIVAILDDLEEEVDRGSMSDLPRDYEPRVGDLLERMDGVFFEVTAFTDLGGGVELEGDSQPLVMYVHRDRLREQFVRLVRRR